MTERACRSAFPTPSRPWTVRNPAPQQTRPSDALPALEIRYSFTWLDDTGRIAERALMGPHLAVFTDAFAALGRGALAQTSQGCAAVEDLLPGDLIVTSAGFRPLRWKGSRVISPQDRDLPLYRITADGFGPERPSPDLVVGPAARVVSRRAALRALIGAETASMPVAALEDSETVIRIRPISAMQVFHLGFDGHTTFTANGVEVESVHPGTLATTLGPEMRTLYLSMFPHIARLEDFGTLALTRLQGDTLDRATAVA